MLGCKSFRRKYRCSVIGFIAVICSIFLFGFSKILYSNHNSINELANRRNRSKSQDIPLIVWWNFMPPNLNDIITTEVGNCELSGNLSLWKEANMILFYGSTIEPLIMPLPRPKDQIWALFHEESPRNVPFLPYNECLQFFNYTATFSRYSDFPFPTYYLPSYEDLVGHEYLMPVSKKSKNNNQSLILFMSSSCTTLTGREDYIRELMEYIQIDSFGNCLHNKDLPESFDEMEFDYTQHLYAPEMMELIASYKYMIAYENGICDDYVTEKFWRPLVAGTIPIYFGTPTVKDWSPNKNSYIDISEFNSPSELASFLLELSADNERYSKYLNHKYNRKIKISNRRLLNELHSRKIHWNNKMQYDEFENDACRRIWNSMRGKLPNFRKKSTNTMVYNCFTKVHHPNMTKSMSFYGMYSYLMSIGYCEAKLLHRLIMENKSYTEEDYNGYLEQIKAAKDCLNLDIY